MNKDISYKLSLEIEGLIGEARRTKFPEKIDVIEKLIATTDIYHEVTGRHYRIDATFIVGSKSFSTQ